MTVSPTFSTAKSSRVLIIGATGFIGHFVADASVDSGRPTYVLVRSSVTSPRKAKIIQQLQNKGAVVLYVLITLYIFELLLLMSLLVVRKYWTSSILVEAIKAVGTVKRFLPSEFGHDVDRADPVEPGLIMYQEKRKVRRLIEELEVLPPLDQFEIYGDGSVKAYFVAGTDIGKFTMKIADDIRTVNKSVHFRPQPNCYNINELACLWEKKIGRTLPRVTVSEDDLLAAAAENIIPQSVVASFTHDIFIKGCQVNFSVDGHDEIEVKDLYPDEQFRSLDDCFTDFAHLLKEKSMEADEKSLPPTQLPTPICA
ncbi:hypothetical protein Pint_23333 [Pistacia integerrima]|uniref:Uncharacterized protein n=1 Tax=Pistacia integerrima TaxID=434235 RepID=A0ACC0YKY7_9ROSI|nr:hypothetical protein Pint_23333 [Pistacia integerrima]